VDFLKIFFEKVISKGSLFMMEFALHGMAEHSLIGKQMLDRGLHFKDLLSSMFSGPDQEDDDDDDVF